MSETLKALFAGKNLMRSILAVLFLLLGFSLMYSVLFHPVEADKKEIAIGIIDFVKSVILIMIGYYFGSSQSSTDKNEMISKP